MDTIVVDDTNIVPIINDYSLRTLNSTEDNYVDFQTWILRLKSLVQDYTQDSSSPKLTDENPMIEEG